MAKVLGYARTSTSEQPNSVEMQQHKLAAYAVATDRVLSDIIVNNASASSLKRPSIDQLIKMVRAGEVSAVLVTKLDRLTRSIADCQFLLQLFARHNVALCSLGESLDTAPTGRMVLNLMVNVFAWRENPHLSVCATCWLIKHTIKLLSDPLWMDPSEYSIVPDPAAMKHLGRAKAMEGSGQVPA